MIINKLNVRPIFFTSLCFLLLILICIKSPAQKSIAVNSKAAFDEVYDNYRKLIFNDLRPQFNKDTLQLVANNLLKWATKNKDEERIVKAKWVDFFYSQYMSNDLEVMKKGAELLNYNYILKSEECYRVYEALLSSYQRTEQFNMALEILPKLYKAGNKWRASSYREKEIITDYANIYNQMGAYEMAIANFKKSKVLINDDALARASLLNNIGLCYKSLGKNKMATEYFNDALQQIEFHLKNGDVEKYNLAYIVHFKNAVLINKISSLQTLPTSQEYEYLLNKLLVSSRRFNEQHFVVSSYYSLAELYFNREDFNASSNYCDSALIELTNYFNAEKLKNVLFLKGKALIFLNKKNEATDVFTKYKSFNDSIRVQRIQKQHDINIIKYQVAEKDLELKVSQTKMLQNEKLNQQQRMGLFIISGLLIIVTFSFFYVFNARKKAVENFDTINLMLNEKVILLKEIHHRVKNNLQIVSGLLELQAIKENNEQFDKMISVSSRSINAIAMVHQLLYQSKDVGKVKMNNYIQRLCDHNLTLLDDNKIKITYLLQEIELPLEKSIPIGLIINELLTNTYKYAYKNAGGEIVIELTENEGICKLLYQDFGKGMELSDAEGGDMSLGLRLIGMLTEELEAKMQRESQNGLKYTFVFDELSTQNFTYDS